MPVDSIVNEIKSYFKQNGSLKTSSSFDKILDDVNKPAEQMGGKLSASPDNSPIDVGTTSDKNPTVSELLKDHKDFEDNLWNIILSDLNKDKQYTKMPLGTKVSIDPQSNELIWAKNVKDSIKDLSTQANQTSLKPTIEKLIEIGKISDQFPTISDLLKNHKDYKNRLWSIILSDININKQYSKITPGTSISINTQTNELIFDSKIANRKGIGRVTFSKDENQSNPISAPGINLNSESKISNQQMIFLGTITKETPTVSHVLKENNQIVGNFWNIIKDPINNNKPFSYLRPGTTISINQETNELSFNLKNLSFSKLHLQSGKGEPIIQSTDKGENKNLNFSDKLVASVKSYIGKPYKEIDCYGLIVRGIEGQGIKYLGKDGLQKQLETMAKMNGLPANSYFTGEGLVNSHGTTLYSKTIFSTKDSLQQANDIYSELENQLENGLILSFSTPSRGHTGIVSQNDDSWTYINSGLIDHNVNTKDRVSRKVGEEILKDEIKNWCRLAKNKGESLKITLGRLNEEKLMKYSNQDADSTKISHI